ncbi:MAG: transcriptional repressor [Candidatus Eremiobacteraeota bacterium]|nr:transcriptional repressor [Candidatus Eremiobacteraeota bacterium]
MRADYATRPREQIATILRDERRFLSAAEVHRALTERKAKVSLSTVYRTLEHLLTKGDAAARVDDAGESTYMLCTPVHHHHHAICRTCGRVEDVDCAAIGQFSDALRSIHGFELDSHKMEFIGRCRNCS